LASLEAIAMQSVCGVRWWVLLGVSACVVACDSSEDIGVDACERARDRVVDLRLADATGVDREAHRAAMQRALGESFVESCKLSMTASQVRCVINATDSASANRCVPAVSGE
jgi:hypothetical protein